ncbi:MarR family winged helix-turn-helix transcriptional regulator [Sinisalibacter lacisalsi]|uniref:Transcriptional regulator n=1 Tax=Sinisalibacter lacisalsi TaxID=1526570 RepID=A0ABQ1QT11_9RHOB|nr:MarR family transcriptional regulator [Sinisalibacter lacisalsi]GGD43438.1 transcriptional regulator [Sinisalibacter lacisalsi]
MNEIHRMAGHQIRRLNQISQALFRERMAAAGVELTPVQYAALATLAERPGLDQASLAADIAYDKVTIGGVIDRLAAKGLVDRRPSPTDRRAKALSLTPEGTALLVRVRPVVWALQDDILGGLSQDERSCFLGLLARLTGAVDANGTDADAAVMK